jgi:hypothetical protein
MVAEYALCYEEGLIWHWKSTAPGKRFGCFKDKATRMNGLEIYRSKPTTRLALCRQLRRETMDLWAKNTTVYFDTSLCSDTKNKIEQVDRAVAACASFLSHAATRKMPGKIVLDGLSFGMNKKALQRLSEALQITPHLDVRVVDKSFDMSGLDYDVSDSDSDSDEENESYHAKEFMYSLEDMRQCVQRCEAWCEKRGLKRGWKVYPCEIREKGLECLQKYPKGARLERALDFLGNGM